MPTQIQSVTIKAGYGYWETTIYPMGGCFRRAKEPIALTDVAVSQTYRGGEPRTFTGRFGKDTIAVSAECCDF